MHFHLPPLVFRVKTTGLASMAALISGDGMLMFEAMVCDEVVQTDR